jgi:hypothetical protein
LYGKRVLDLLGSEVGILSYKVTFASVADADGTSALLSHMLLYRAFFKDDRLGCKLLLGFLVGIIVITDA